MKWLILLALIIVLIVFVAGRYRQQIKMAIYVWRMFRKMRQASKTEEKEIEKLDNPKDVALVRCAKCGSWISRKKALNLRSGIYYCSRTCLETTANVN
jgi:Sec-independent protein translocase protein TatA